MLLAILGEFGNAKLDIGGELQGFMAELLHARFGAEAQTLDEHALSRQWAQFTEVANGDVFALHDHLTEQAGAFPPEYRSAMAAAMIQADRSDRSRGDRRPLAGSLRAACVQSSPRRWPRASRAGLVTGIMLRRMIAMRNWLPEAERPGLDGVIQAARKRGLECAAWPAPLVQEVIASPFDGSGAQSLFVIVRQGRKFAVAALLVEAGHRGPGCLGPARAVAPGVASVSRPRWQRSSISGL